MSASDVTTDTVTTETDGATTSSAAAESGVATEPRVATDPPRSRRPLLIRLAWLGGLVVALIVLSICYIRASRTYPVTSDGASNALQAWEMLHGNLLLHGWTVTDVSFYTTELPEYMLVEAIRGLSADVLHVSAGITYALVVLTGGMLARGTATGREGLLRMLIAAGIMCAPQLGPGIFILVFQPDHIGTQVPLLLTWLVLDRAPRRWYVPVAIGAMLTWVEVAARLAVLIGAVPLAAVAAIRVYQAVVQRRERPVTAWFDGSLVLAAGISVELSKVIVKQIGLHGGFSVLPVQGGLTSLSDLPAHAWLLLGSVLGLYGGDFFGLTTLGVGAGLIFLHLIGLAFAVWALWIVVRRFLSWPDLISQILVVGIAVNVVAYLLSTTPTTYWSAREIAGVLPAGAVLAGRVLTPRLRSARLVPAAAVVLACYLIALGHIATQPPRPAVTQSLANYLAAHHLDYGLSSYGVANTTTLASGGRVGVRPVSFTGARAAAGPYEFDRSWYDPAQHDATFVVLGKHPAALDGITDKQVMRVFGYPARVYDTGQFEILAYNTNLLAELSPSHPRPGLPPKLGPRPASAPAPAPSPSPSHS